MITRRRIVCFSGAALAAATLPVGALAAVTKEAEAKGRAELLGNSSLVYISPLKKNGKHSRCQAEVWYASEGSEAYVVTASDAWRSKAVSRGLNLAQVWIGDVGQWQSAKGRYRELPSAVAAVSLIEEATDHARVLALFGDKYSREWFTWGPRFKRGLADGSRVMLRYSLS